MDIVEEEKTRRGVARQPPGARTARLRRPTASNAPDTAVLLPETPAGPPQPPFTTNPGVIQLSQRFQQQIIDAIVNHLDTAVDTEATVTLSGIRDTYKVQFQQLIENLKTQLEENRTDHAQWSEKINNSAEKLLAGQRLVSSVEQKLQNESNLASNTLRDSFQTLQQELKTSMSTNLEQYSAVAKKQSDMQVETYKKLANELIDEFQKRTQDTSTVATQLQTMNEQLQKLQGENSASPELQGVQTTLQSLIETTKVTGLRYDELMRLVSQRVAFNNRSIKTRRLNDLEELRPKNVEASVLNDGCCGALNVRDNRFAWTPCAAPRIQDDVFCIAHTSRLA